MKPKNYKLEQARKMRDWEIARKLLECKSFRRDIGLVSPFEREFGITVEQMYMEGKK